MPRTSKRQVPANAKLVKETQKRLGKYIEEKNITDPRKQTFLKFYFDPSSPTFSNAYQSALQAGFSPYYAKMILAKNARGWIQDFQTIFREKILNKAEIRLWELMHSDSDKVSADMTKFALSTLGKETYSPKTIEEHHQKITHELSQEQVSKILDTMRKMPPMIHVEAK